MKKNFSDAKTVSISKASTVSRIIKNLTAGKTYWVRIRSWKKVGTKTYQSAWSKGVSVKVK